MSEHKEFKFDKGINLRMCQILEQKDSAGIVLFGTVKTPEGAHTPVMVVNEHIKNKELFMQRFFQLLAQHGITLP